MHINSGHCLTLYGGMNMKKRILLLASLLVLGTATLLTGCGPEKTVGDQQMDLAQKLEDQAQEAVDQLNKQNPDALLDIKGE